MIVPGVLLIILFILMSIVGGKRGIRSFFTLFFNFVVLFFMIIFIALNADPIKVTSFGCIIISIITLFYINGYNKKTLSSIIAVTITVIVTMLLVYKIGSNAKIQGFSLEELEGISFININVHLDFAKIFICQVLIGLIGAIIDVSITVSSSMNEIYSNNPAISKYSLLMSGISIGKDILGTMTNTLLFAYIGGFMTLIIYFYCIKYPIEEIINKKIFCSEIFQILCSGIGIVLIIPVTALISTQILSMRSGKSNKVTDNI